MRVDALATTRALNGEPPRSTAYYYGDLERLKKKDPGSPPNPDELSEYVESNEVIDDGAVRDIPPLRDRLRQFSLPEYSTPENCRRLEETYSTAGTFPMPEPKEKEPLLAELEVVGRLPLTQLESNSDVRRSRSWYLCCPNVAEEEISRESSWRYSSLRPVTVPPLPKHSPPLQLTTQSSGREDVTTLKAERDALARALSTERQRAAAAARAHDARLAELHGVIAELVRRRAADKQTKAIPEEEGSDECESITQPAGELDNDADRSKTEQNDTSSALSPDLPTPQESRLQELHELPDDTTETSTRELDDRMIEARLEGPIPIHIHDDLDSLHLSNKETDACHTARCSPHSGMDHAPPLCVETCTPRCESRQAKLASRVRLRKTEDSDHQHTSDETWSTEAAERLALDVCAQADLREALVAANNDGSSAAATAAVWRARARRLQADCTVLQCALSRATDTAHRLWCACASLESSCVCVCGALRAADVTVEVYDVLLALSETRGRGDGDPQRLAAELVAKQLLCRLDSEQPTVNAKLLSPGPWLHHHHLDVSDTPWSDDCESRLREHCVRLKADTVALRARAPEPRLFSLHDIDDEDIPQKPATAVSMVEMEAAVMMQEVLSAQEANAVRAVSRADTAPVHKQTQKEQKSDSTRSRRRRERHWLEAASETDL